MFSRAVNNKWVEFLLYKCPYCFITKLSRFFNVFGKNVPKLR